MRNVSTLMNWPLEATNLHSNSCSKSAFASDTAYKALEPMLTVSNGTLMLLSTPNGQLGYFYEQWHLPDSPWTKIFGTLDDCPRVNKDAIEGMRKSMAKACLLYTSPSPRDRQKSRMPSSA